ncbi:MAG: TRAP transporter small permease [Spirochaetota bacterium]
MMRRVVERLTQALEWLSTGIMVAILVMVSLQIVFRDLFKVSAPWTEEGARYLLVAMVFSGSAVVFQRNGHTKLSILHRVGPGTSFFLDVFGDLVVLACSVVFFIGSVTMVRMNWQIPSITIPFAPLGILYVFSAGGAALVTVFASLRLAERFLGR